MTNDEAFVYFSGLITCPEQDWLFKFLSSSVFCLFTCVDPAQMPTLVMFNIGNHWKCQKIIGKL